MKHVYFYLLLISTSVGIGQTVQQVPLDYSFSLNFSTSVNDEKGQEPILNTSFANLNDGPVVFSGTGAGNIPQGNKLLYSNVNARPQDAITVVGNVRLNQAVYDLLPVGQYFQIFKNGSMFIRILKQNGVSTLQTGVYNGQGTNFGFVETSYTLTTDDLNALFNEFTTIWMRYDRNQLLLDGQVNGTYFSQSSAANLPIGYLVADTTIQLGSPTAAPFDFSGTFDNWYIYNRALDATELGQFITNLDENIKLMDQDLSLAIQQPLDANVAVQWFSVVNGFRTPIAGANSGTYLPTANGTYGAYLEYTYRFQVNQTITEYVDWNNISTADLTEESQVNVSIYPNPASSSVSIAGAKGLAYVIVDAQGQEMKHGVCEEETSVSLYELSAGIYFVKVGNHFERLVKQ